MIGIGICGKEQQKRYGVRKMRVGSVIDGVRNSVSDRVRNSEATLATRESVRVDLP